MKLRSLFSHAGLGAIVLLASMSAVLAASGLSLSVGTSFLPGYRMPDGGDLNTVLSAVNTLRSQADGTVANTGSLIQSTSATCDTVGPNGLTAPTLNIDCSVASQATGINLVGAASGSGVALTALGGTNEPVFLAGKGTGPVYVGGTTTTLAGLQVAQTASRVNDFVLTPTATGTSPTFLAGGAGADASSGAVFGTAGTGVVNINTDSTVPQFQVSRTATAVDFLSCKGAATANPALVVCTATGSDTNVDVDLVSKAAGNVKLGTAAVSTCSGTTTATCQGQRFVVSITSLTTAASTLSAAMTVTNANVVSSASTVMCQVNLYTGTGVPIAVNVTPGTGSVAINIQNVSTAAALNATVPVACVVFGT